MHKQNFTYKSILTLTTALGMVMIVSGCNESAEEVAAAATATFASTAEATLAKHASEDGSLSANGVTLIRSNVPVTRSTTSVTLTPGDESVTASALNETVTFTDSDKFTNEDGSVYYENDDGWISFNGDSAEDILDGKSTYKFMTPVRGGMATKPETYSDRYYAVIGLETPEAHLVEKANASYSGRFSMDVYPLDNPSNEVRIRENGDVSLQANFAEGNINGSLTFNPDSEDELEVGLAETDISGNSFATTFSHETDTEKSTGEFAGKFYGNEAQEAGGTIGLDQQFTVDGVTTKEVGAGNWVATENSAVAAAN